MENEPTAQERADGAIRPAGHAYSRVDSSPLHKQEFDMETDCHASPAPTTDLPGYQLQPPRLRSGPGGTGDPGMARSVLARCAAACGYWRGPPGFLKVVPGTRSAAAGIPTNSARQLYGPRRIRTLRPRPPADGLRLRIATDSGGNGRQGAFPPVRSQLSPSPGGRRSVLTASSPEAYSSTSRHHVRPPRLQRHRGIFGIRSDALGPPLRR